METFRMETFRMETFRMVYGVRDRDKEKLQLINKGHTQVALSVW